MKRTVIWVLYILMGVQIAFGFAYFVSNFGITQQFRENLDFFLPMEAVCLIQLTLAVVSNWYVLGELGFRENRYMRGYVCAFLLTVPWLLQMHMARLVWSMAFSVFLWLSGLILQTIREGISGKRTLLLFVAYLLYGIICPDGVYLGGFLLLFLFSQKKQVGARAGFRFGAAAFLTACIIFTANWGLNNTFPEARTIYRENNLGVTAVSRLVWPNFGKNYFFWDDDVKAVLSEERAVWISWRVDLVGEEFYPLLEENYGKKEATKLCLEMGLRCLKDRTRETISEMGQDLKDYFLLPYTIERNLKGEGSSLTAWNYGRMREHTPVLVKYYYRYGTFELPVLLLGSFLLWAFQISEQIGMFLRRNAVGKEAKRELLRPGEGKEASVRKKMLFYVLILYTVWYAARSNVPIDYKLTLPILFIWYLASAAGLLYGTAGNQCGKSVLPADGGNEEWK